MGYPYEPRRQTEETREDREQWRDCFILGAEFSAIGLIGTVCLVLNVLPGRTAESMNWATSALLIIVGIAAFHETCRSHQSKRARGISPRK